MVKHVPNFRRVALEPLIFQVEARAGIEPALAFSKEFLLIINHLRYLKTSETRMFALNSALNRGLSFPYPFTNST